MSRSSLGSVALAVAWRQMHNYLTNRAILIPSLVFPFFFLVAFAAGLSSISDVPGFDFPSGYTAFQFVWALLQSAAFGGVFTGFAIAADFESGFARRLLLAAPNRSGILAGYALAALARALITGVLLFAGALLSGMHVDGSPLQLLGLFALAVLMNMAAGFWAAGIALRLRSLQAGALMQVPVFLALFLAPVWVPLELLTGWVEAVASVNPVTALLEAGRGFISGRPSDSALAFGVGAALVLVFALWGFTGLRRAEKAG